MPDVYMVLGLPGSGRREIVDSLIEGVLNEGDSIAIYQAEEDAPLKNDAPAGKLARRAGVGIVPFHFAEGRFAIAEKTAEPEDPEAVFFFADGRASVIDQLEAFPNWLKSRGWELSRILLVVNSALAAANPPVDQWYEACAHFADCILLNRRDAASHAWAQQFQKKLHANRYPCLVLPVKNGQVENPHLVLFPEARRLSLVFDKIDPIDELELDEENLPEEPFTLENKPDPYFERAPNGQRRKMVPDVTALLPAP